MTVAKRDEINFNYFFDQKKIQQRPKVSFSFNHDRLTNYLAVGKVLIM